jgi:DNA polymerase-4
MYTNRTALTNTSLPYTVHIDLNSCFAIIEQQANRLLRGRPVGVSAYDTPRGFVLASSYEAKAKGVKLGVNVAQARAMAPGIVIMTPDPAKYREAHKLFKTVLSEYSSDISPKSIDEFVLDMENSPVLKKKKHEIRNTKQIRSSKIASLKPRISDAERQLHNQAMLQIGHEIKQKIRESLGEYVTVNIGISTNKFLAKYAAGFGKPDGMTLIDHTNLEQYYKDQILVDLPGINIKFRARLRAEGIYTPLDFLEADLDTLKKRVFKSINGYHWYMRLRGYETDTVEFSRKSIGHQHALSNKTTDMAELERLLMKLCEKTGRRLRKNNLYATGIHLYLGFVSDMPMHDGPSSFENMPNIRSWHHGERVFYRLYSTLDIYKAAKKLLHQAKIPARVKIMSVNVFKLADWSPEQLSIFDTVQGPSLYSKESGKKDRVQVLDADLRSAGARKRVSDAVDAINNRYGEFVITPAVMLGMQGDILDRVAFGQVRDL